MITLNIRLKIIIFSVALILLVPLIAMQFTNEVNWNLIDFLIAGTLLLGTGLILEFILRKINKKEKRIILYIIIMTILLLIWMELAVGILGTPFAGS